MTTIRRLLERQAALLAETRSFFVDRAVLEVTTPILLPAGVSDPATHSFQCTWQAQPSSTPPILYVQTSPEYAMKRLLAAGSGCIYQIASVARDGELGPRHLPSFNLLEWYRLGYDLAQLMQEVSDYLSIVAAAPPAVLTTYRALFETHCQLNPHQADLAALRDAIAEHGIVCQSIATLDRDACLDLLMVSVIEPSLAAYREPVIVYDYPESQAALAKIVSKTDRVAERFEVYWQGMELANGYHELTCPQEQRQRFRADNDKRRTLGLPEIPADEALLAAMSDPGLPACAGVALGLDRLLMLLAQVKTIDWGGFFAEGVV